MAFGRERQSPTNLSTASAPASAPTSAADAASPHNLAARLRNLASSFPRFQSMFDRQRNTPAATSSTRGSNRIGMKMTRGVETYQQQIQKLEDIIAELLKQVAFKDEQIAYLSSELDKYQSVFNQKPSVLGVARSWEAKMEIRGTKSETDGGRRNRGIGISAEPRALKMDEKEHPKHYPKTAKTREILNQAILENDFMKNLDTSQVVEIVECMYSVNFATGNTIIREGELGSVVYVMEEGVIEVSREGNPLRLISHPTVFGELAILYNCMRTATVKALNPCSLWAIDRKSFQAVMMQTGILKHHRHLEFLKSVPTFAQLASETLAKFVDLLEEVHYEPGEYVIRQGARGDTFYIIASGQVQVTQNARSSTDTPLTSTSPKEEKETFVRLMGRGEWFGEKALKNEDVRTANIIAAYPNGVDCLVLDRESYELLVGDLGPLERQYPDEDLLKHQAVKSLILEFGNMSLQDLTVVATLGVGGFGRVELVYFGKDSSQTFALKKLKKHHVVLTKQEKHVMNERIILMSCNSEFIVRLYRTFKDRKYLYLLMEACLGGELWTVLRNRLFFPEAATQFYVACVVEALTYLHSQGIVYRDLKPENLLLDQYGYCKMTDFGFAKKIGFGRKTWTFCGTPEYIAPEIILNKGHDFFVDSWSLGILIYELMNGTPPFTSEEPMKTYNIILKGIDAIEFPRKITRNAQHLIKKLCRENPTDRFGYGRGGLKAIKKHVWFEGFDWRGLRNRNLKPPFVPRILSPTDVTNFDYYTFDQEEPPDDVSGWDNEF
ncbi:cGMP dependent protein kinase 1 [Echinococcus multilocularis]|uniref:cGMP-dependent protein kinase n=1 Tax=Echinococcus multilocularis TaxID=6211 RepID=A0A068Y9V5_ECHMU|nr:cGMP dependent protein kinase 1 [Echinococcus multilocularis]